GRDVGGGQGSPVLKFHTLPDFECIGLALIRWLRNFETNIADKPRRVGWLRRIDTHQDAVKRRNRMDGRVGPLPMAIQARWGISRYHVDERAATLRDFHGRRNSATAKRQGNGKQRTAHAVGSPRPELPGNRMFFASKTKAKNAM